MQTRQTAQEYCKRGHDTSIAAMNFAAYRGHPRLSILHSSLMAPKFSDSKDGDIQIHSLSPKNTVEKLKLLPLALRILPTPTPKIYYSLHKFCFPAYKSLVGPRLAKLMECVDVVHSLAADYIAWTAEQEARKRHIPFVCTPFVHPNQWGDDPENVSFYKKCDAVIGLLTTDTGYLETLGVSPQKLHVISNAPDLPETVDGPGFRERHQFGNLPIVLYVGRMMPQKGAKAIVEAAPKIWEKVPDAQIVFIGPGSPDELAIFEGADKRLHYLGKVSAQEKGDALAACDIFCMPSLSEILPTVYLEAWCLGKPVIGGMAHGLPELVEGNNGGLCVEQTSDAVANALLLLLENQTLREKFGEGGRAAVEARHSNAVVVDKLLNLYSSLIKSNQSKKA